MGAIVRDARDYRGGLITSYGQMELSANLVKTFSRSLLIRLLLILLRLVFFSSCVFLTLHTRYFVPFSGCHYGKKAPDKQAHWHISTETNTRRRVAAPLAS
jgi:hypothetical protein